MELTWSSFMARSRNWLAAAMTKTLWPTHCTNYAIRKQHDSQPILRSFTPTFKGQPVYYESYLWDKSPLFCPFKAKWPSVSWLNERVAIHSTASSTGQTTCITWHCLWMCLSGRGHPPVRRHSKGQKETSMASFNPRPHSTPRATTYIPS